MNFERQESALLRKKIDQFAKDKIGTCVLVRGELGIGKSEIVKTVVNIHRIAPSIRENDNYVRRIISVSYDVDELFQGEELSLNIWKNLVKDVEISCCNNSVDISNSLTRADYMKLVNKVISDGAIDFWLKLIPVFGDYTINGIKSINGIYNSYKEALTNKNRDRELFLTNNQIDIFDKIMNYLFKISLRIPMILFINNVQWGDDTSLKFLSYLIKHIKLKSYPLFIILTYSDREILGNKIINRNKFREIFIYLKRHILIEEIIVNNLSKLEIESYLKFQNPSQITDTNFSDKIYELSRGNVFYINMILNGFSEVKNTSLNILDRFPESISEIIENYLGELTNKAKNLLRICSVMGETFSLEVILKLFVSTEEIIEDLIQELVDKGLIMSSKKKLGNMRKVYQFTQPLICKYIYSTYDENLRLNKHKQISEFLSNSQSIQNYNMYVYHWGIGHNVINESNEIIINKFDIEDEELYNDADKYLKNMINLYQKYRLNFVFDEALYFNSKIISLAKLLNKEETFAEYSISKVEVLCSVGKYTDALLTLKDLYQIYQTLNDETKAMLELQRGNLYERTDENVKALTCFRRAKKLYEKKQ